MILQEVPDQIAQWEKCKAKYKAGYNFGLEKLILEKITWTMDTIDVPWFFCFGKVLGFIKYNDFDLNYDIDIGIFQEDVADLTIKRVWIENGYELTHEMIDDYTKLPLNYHFKPIDHNIIGTPHIDIFFWYKHNGAYYHTYDTLREGKTVPSKYVFRGVPEDCLKPSKEFLANNIMRDNTLTKHGTWKYCIFDPIQSHTFRMPFSYGKLLDIWYPGWLFQEEVGKPSKSELMVTMKSCREWPGK